MGFSHVSSLLFKDSAGESVIVVLIVLPDTFQIMGNTFSLELVLKVVVCL